MQSEKKVKLQFVEIVAEYILHMHALYTLYYAYHGKLSYPICIVFLSVNTIYLQIIERK